MGVMWFRLGFRPYYVHEIRKDQRGGTENRYEVNKYEDVAVSTAGRKRFGELRLLYGLC
jgi:hypothetical protein